MTNVNNVPELIPGKDYHIFVSYSTEDQDVAETVVSNLERNGIKCCFHGRDFMPGEEVLNNVNRAIQKSMYVLILISEQYVRSKFCTHETSVALHAKLENMANIIPVKIEPCEIPTALSQITYIDSEEGRYENLHTKIIEKMMERENWMVEENVITGFTIDIQVTRTRSRSEIVFGDQTLTRIKDVHKSVSDDQLDSVLEFVNDTIAIRHNATMVNYRRTCLFLGFYPFLMSVGFLFAALTFTPNAPQRYHSPGCLALISLSAITCVLAITVWVGLLSCVSGWVTAFYGAAVRDLNEKGWTQFNHDLFWKQHCLFIFTGNKLVFMQYNAEPCVSYFSRHSNDVKCLRQDVHDNRSDKEYARSVFSDYLKMNSMLLTESNYDLRRHKTHNGAPCLCLQVQQWLA